VAHAIQDAAPDQSCTIEIWYPDSLGDVIDTVGELIDGDGTGGQQDCEGRPSAKGDCVETIQSLVSDGGNLAELAADIISALSGTTAVDICNELCVKGCYGVLGWAMWWSSPCIRDAAPLATFRIVCIPPWGLVAVVVICVVCKVCCSGDDEPEESGQATASAAAPARDQWEQQPAAAVTTTSNPIAGATPPMSSVNAAAEAANARAEARRARDMSAQFNQTTAQTMVMAQPAPEPELAGPQKTVAVQTLEATLLDLSLSHYLAKMQAMGCTETAHLTVCSRTLHILDSTSCS